MTLNIIYNGTATEYELAGLMGLNDLDIKRVAEEVHGLTEGDLTDFVVDRYGDKLYVRPKVPFGRG